LRNQLVFEILTVASTEILNAVGEKVETWETAFPAPIPGEMVNQSSREFAIAQQIYPDLTAVFRIRYLKALDPNLPENGDVGGLYRINLGDKIWNIAPPVPNDRKSEMLISGFSRQK